MHLIINLCLVALALCATAGVTRQMKPNVKEVSHLAPVAVAASTALTNNGVDTQGFDSAMFIVNTGAVAGAGDYSVVMYESPTNNSDWTAVAAADMDVDIGPTATLVAATAY